MMNVNKLLHTSTSIKTNVFYPSHRTQTMNRFPQIVLLLIILIIASGVAACASPIQQNVDPNKTAEATPSLAVGPSFSTPLRCPQDQGNTVQQSFVEKDGTQFTYRQMPLKLYGYTFYRGPSQWQRSDFTQEIDAALTMGAQAGQNLARPTDFWDKATLNQDMNDPTIWRNMDYLVCSARLRGTFVVMDISAFRWLLVSKGRDPYDFNNWKAFLDEVGTHYSNQPSIAFYSIAGEPDPPKTTNDTHHLVNFYRSVTDELSKADKNHHLITAGGFNHMEDETPQTPWWHEIYALPHNDIIAFKTYSQKDLNLIPTIASYAKQLGKPMVDEEFGLPQSMGDAASTGEVYNQITTSRAQFFEQVYTRGEENGVLGFVFWDMGCELAEGSYQVSSKTPAVWHVIQAHAPNKVRSSEECK